MCTREGAEVGTEASRSRFLSTWIECIFTARVYGGDAAGWTQDKAVALRLWQSVSLCPV
ncbi:MAG: hypothetical protein ACPIOQ_41295 [Promethearchaeia archaeon]